MVFNVPWERFEVEPLGFVAERAEDFFDFFALARFGRISEPSWELCAGGTIGVG
jgi:hypothetical protein